MDEKKRSLFHNLDPKKETVLYWGILAVIGLLFLFSRLYLLGAVPRGIHVDEAGMAYDAYCLANYGVDRHLIRFPVYLTNYGSGQSALYAYLAAIFIKLFGFSVFIFRLPAVLSGGLVLVFGYLIGKEAFGKWRALLLAFFLTICPYFIMASRWGLDCNLFLGFFTMSLYFLILAVKKGKLPWFALAGFSFGVTLYTYAVSYVTLPVFLGLTLLYLIWCKKIRVSQALVFTLPLALLAVPLLLFIAVNSGLLGEIHTPLFTIHRLEYYRAGEFSLANIPANKKIPWELLTHDFLPYNSFEQYGTLYFISIPLIIAGILLSLIDTIRAVRKRTFKINTLIFLMFFTILCIDMVMMLPNINKSNAIYFSLAVFLMLAVGRLVQTHWSVLAVAAAVYGCFFLSFGNYYYNHYPKEVYPQQYFNDSLMLMLDIIETEYEDGTKRNIYVDIYDDNVSQPYIYTLIRNRMSPYEWNQKKGRDNSYDYYHFYMPEEQDPTGIYIMYSNEGVISQLESEGFHYEPFDHWRIYSK